MHPVGPRHCVRRVASAAEPGEPRIGQFVYAVGYPNGGKLAISGGEVMGLHAYDGAKVIRMSAPFDHGASGGALLDRDGRLLGILTFKARAGGAYHFAVPVEWLAAKPDATEAEQAFWEGPRESQPYFLRALALESYSVGSEQKAAPEKQREASERRELEVAKAAEAERQRIASLTPGQRAAEEKQKREKAAWRHYIPSDERGR